MAQPSPAPTNARAISYDLGRCLILHSPYGEQVAPYSSFVLLAYPQEFNPDPAMI